jgi:hypothetical protein
MVNAWRMTTLGTASEVSRWLRYSLSWWGPLLSIPGLPIIQMYHCQQSSIGSASKAKPRRAAGIQR